MLACLPVPPPCLPALGRTLCSLILKAMQDPEYAPYLDDAIAREKKRHDGVRGARCAVAGGSAAQRGCNWASTGEAMIGPACEPYSSRYSSRWWPPAYAHVPPVRPAAAAAAGRMR
jgi:hypothetical protein